MVTVFPAALDGGGDLRFSGGATEAGLDTFGRALPGLVLLFANLLAVALAGKCFLDTLLLAWLQVEGVTLDLFDDVFGLNLTLEAAKSVLEGLTLLNTNLCHRKIHLQTVLTDQP